MKDLKNIIYTLSSIERKVLPYILDSNCIGEISKKSNLTVFEVTTAVQLLEERGYSIYKKEEESFICLDKFGLRYVDGDLPEINFLKQILDGEKKQSQLKLEKDEIGSALGILKRNKLISIRKDEGMVYSATDLAKSWFDKNKKNPLLLFKDEVSKNNLSNDQKEVLESFKMRKGFLKEFIKKSFSVSLSEDGVVLVNEVKNKYLDLDLIESLDTTSLKTGSWKNKEFRHYDVKVNTMVQDLGRAHPMMEANNILSDIFVEMGFSQMDGPMVESAFWNMDVMWIPQDHPARDEQDTFYLDGSIEVPKKYFESVKNLHEVGIKRTHTVKGDFKKDVSEKQLLRTHSTSTSFRYLAELGEKLKKGEDINGKYFYVTNIFRNEAVDATHLAEFFQGEGFIVGDDLSLADLKGFITKYLEKLGYNELKFKPTFNPYTQPSMEVHYYDEEIGKSYAVINSGIFRPETLKPFGLENKTVIAWGFGASRIAAKLAKKKSMRDITGHTCDFTFLKSRPIMKRKIIR